MLCMTHLARIISRRMACGSSVSDHLKSERCWKCCSLLCDGAGDWDCALGAIGSATC